MHGTKCSATPREVGAIKLYSFQPSPNTRRVRIFAAEKGIAIEMIEVNVVAGENLAAPYQAINPRGLVPTLELDNGTFLDESVAICRYLESLSTEPNLLGKSDQEIAQIESAQRHVEFDGLLPLVDAFRNRFPGFSQRGVAGYPAHFPAIPELADRGRQQYRIFQERLEVRLAAHEFVAGDKFTIADITALCAVGLGKSLDLDLRKELKESIRWYESVSSRASAGA
ncbi:MAG: glutathione S-transferase N-terminal domain-containing protein [Gammaproteobacteria bacterium]|nr:glutathione S-transferase N-terminal domain-containing protein [Gammaproteobacteria bacterium]